MSSLWSQATEKEFFTKALKFASKEQLFYKTDKKKYVAYWPRGYEGEKTTLQSRNSLIGNFTEKWSLDLIIKYAKSKGYFALQGVICEEIGLTNMSPADVAICKKNSTIQNAEDIVAIFEVKMSVVWNWEYLDGELIELGDFTRHQGNPGLLRSDSMLKAIGKSINIRVSSFASSRIPIVILGNTPITKSYEIKVDHLKQCGIIQGFLSVNPCPRGKTPTIKSTKGGGFVRMDTYDELVKYLDLVLSHELTFFSSMKSKKELGEIINIAGKEKELEKKAEKFLELIRVGKWR